MLPMFKFAPNSGYKATKFIDYTSNKMPFLSGKEFEQNKQAKIIPFFRAEQSMGRVLRNIGINKDQLSTFECNGVVMPSTCTQLGYTIAKSVGQKYNQMLSKQVRNFDGSFDTLPPVHFIGDQERGLAGGILTTRMFYNLVSSTPITQQQAALNFAILAHYAQDKSNPKAQLANYIACDVGSKWSILPSATPAIMGLNSVNSSTGLVHLYEDVPNAIVKYLEMNLKGKVSSDEALEVVHLLGSSCEIAKQAALGSLDGTQHYMNKMQENLPILGCNVPYMEGFRLLAARVFFTPDSVEGAVQARDKYVIAAMQEYFAKCGTLIEPKKLKDAFEDGADKAEGEAEHVKHIANKTSKRLADQNVDGGESLQ